MKWTEIRQLSCDLLGEPLPVGRRLPNGAPEALREAVAEIADDPGIKKVRGWLCGIIIPDRYYKEKLEMVRCQAKN